MELVIGILLVVAGLFLVAAILLQSSKDSKLSSSIAGGAAETFFGKNKAKTMDAKFKRWTVAIAVAMLVCSVLFFVFYLLRNAL
ncbi:MAG: preprotein translocase subunit SecG [Clostridia bacterium]|nr:preprotein translocase subunit SecG [Clostridia bacterium]